MDARDKLAAIRNYLRHHDLGGFILPHEDEFLCEFTPPHYERLAWLTEFTGSAGLAIVLPKEAALFSDGRYLLQMKEQLDPSLWQGLHNREISPAEWLNTHRPPDKPIAYDPRIMSAATLRPFEDLLGEDLYPLSHNIVDDYWTDRPPLDARPGFTQPRSLSGISSQEKCRAIARKLTQNGRDALILSNSDSIAWLFNLRGYDIPCTPVCLAYAILHADARADIFSFEGKIPQDVATQCNEHLHVHPFSAFEEVAQTFKGRCVSIDPRRNAVWFDAIFEQIGADIAYDPDPCVLAKSIKNQTECQGMRRAHQLDGIALCRFLHWFSKNAAHSSELNAAEILHQFRADLPDFVEESFPTISAAGAHAASPHYSATQHSNAHFHDNMLYLVDSGGQYHCGTTDCTRTLWHGPHAPPQHLKNAFTYVLKGHLRLSRASFPAGTTGGRLDALARYDLWCHGMDYDHGTGHGVGCFLSVHEGPVSISKRLGGPPLEVGMVLSNEPGYYLPKHWGIRLENLLLVKEATIESDEGRRFYQFEPLTLAPFDRQLINRALLTTQEIAQLNHYHHEIYNQIAPHLENEAALWLKEACKEI